MKTEFSETMRAAFEEAQRAFNAGDFETAFANLPDDVDVYYDPENPSEAYLQLEKSPTVGWVVVGIGVFIALIGLGFLLGS